jgi:hypothetical protein
VVFEVDRLALCRLGRLWVERGAARVAVTSSWLPTKDASPSLVLPEWLPLLLLEACSFPASVGDVSPRRRMEAENILEVALGWRTNGPTMPPCVAL